MTTGEFVSLRKWAGAVRALPVLVVAGSLPACTEFADGDDSLPPNTSVANNPLQGEGGSTSMGGPEWSCLGNAAPATPPMELGDTDVTYTVFIADTITRQPPAGLVVSACSPLDIECTRPMADGITPDADGVVRARIPRNFAGFFRVLSDQTVPSTLFIDGAVTEDTEASPMLLIGQGPFQVLTQSQGVAIDQQMGHLLLRAYDCNKELAPGIRFSSDRGGQPFAFVDGLPVVGQTVTDTEGTAGFLNVLPGLAVVQSVQVMGGALTRTASGRVRAGWFTYVDLEATLD
jgi:hypothetical protein